MAEIQGNRIKQIRRELGMTQDELAAKIEVKKLALLSYETGKRNPEMKTLVKLAHALTCTTDYLLGLNDNRIDERSIDNDDNWDIIKYALQKYGEKHRTIIADTISLFLEDTAKIVAEPDGDRLHQLGMELLNCIALCFECVRKINSLKGGLESVERVTALRLLDELLNDAMRILIDIGKICRASTGSLKTQDAIKTFMEVLHNELRLKPINNKTFESIWLQIRDVANNTAEVSTNADTQE